MPDPRPVDAHKIRDAFLAGKLTWEEIDGAIKAGRIRLTAPGVPGDAPQIDYQALTPLGDLQRTTPPVKTKTDEELFGSPIADRAKGVWHGTLGPIADMGKKFVEGMGEQITGGAGNYLRTSAEMVPSMGPLAFAPGVAGGVKAVGKQIVGGQIDATKQLALRSGEELEKGNMPGAVSAGLASVTPLVGPAVFDASENFDTREGQGRLAGTLLALRGAPKALSKGAAALAGKAGIPNVPLPKLGWVDKALDAAATPVTKLIPKVPQPKDGAPTGKFANFVEQTVPGKTAFQNLRRRQWASATDRATSENIAREAAYAEEVARIDQENIKRQGQLETARGNAFSGKQQGMVDAHQGYIDDALTAVRQPNVIPDLQPHEVGNLVRSRLTDFKSTAQTKFQNADVALNTGDVGVIPTTNLKTVARNLRTELEQSSVIPLADRTQVTSWLEQIENMPNQITYRQAATSLSDLLAAERRIGGGVLKSRQYAEKAAISDALRRDLDAGLEQLQGQGLDPQVVADLRDAKTAWYDLHRPAVTKLLERLESEPESAHKVFLESATTAEDLGHIRKVVGRDAYDNMRVLAVRDLIEPLVKTDMMTTMAGDNVLFKRLSGEQGLNNVRTKARLNKLLPQPVANVIFKAMEDAAKEPDYTKPAEPVLDRASGLPRTAEPLPSPPRPEPVPRPKLYNPATSTEGLRSSMAQVYNAVHQNTMRHLMWAGPSALGLRGMGNPMAEGVSGAVLGAASVVGASDLALRVTARVLVDPRGANVFISLMKSNAAQNTFAAASAMGRLEAIAEEEARKMESHKKQNGQNERNGQNEPLTNLAFPSTGTGTNPGS